MLLAYEYRQQQNVQRAASLAGANMSHTDNQQANMRGVNLSETIHAESLVVGAKRIAIVEAFRFIHTMQWFTAHDLRHSFMTWHKLPHSRA
jgi:uncharacterized protein YjbI with pentapeptide repeats